MANHDDAHRHDSDNLSTSAKLGQLYELIDDIEIALMTTRRADGSLVSRPMATQARAEGSDLWFVTNAETGKIDELETDPNVNLAYYENGEHVGVSPKEFARVARLQRALDHVQRAVRGARERRARRGLLRPGAHGARLPRYRRFDPARGA